jgi:hypothetical protein
MVDPLLYGGPKPLTNGILDGSLSIRDPDAYITELGESKPGMVLARYCYGHLQTHYFWKL